MLRQFLSSRCTIISLFLLTDCNNPKNSTKLFSTITSEESGLDFQNDIRETPEFNIIEYLYFYNGGGAAIGDINNDGLLDVYLSRNQGPNELYLNEGNFKFKNVTNRAGVAGEGNWKTGVAMADINSDGLLDIFVCGVGGYKNFDGFNQVFINQGDQTFKESAKELGLYFQGFSTHVAFLDYDLDGDLDIYLLNHSVHSVRSYGDVSLRQSGSELAGDKLYENQYFPSGKTFFVDVAEKAGIYNSHIGYGLGVGISDINKDGWPDIYVSNDFQENDYLYLNKKNGTFRQVTEESFGHTSRFSMGNDIADINNDGLADIVTLDMLPQDESVIKTSAGEDTYEIYKFKLTYNFNPQTSRNCLQLNCSVTDTSVVFSDIAMLSGLGATDWSWAPLIADFDLDGFKDIFITNGIMRRPNNLDYINYISDQEVQTSLDTIDQKDLKIIDMMPGGKVSNYLFKNNGDLTFRDISIESGISTLSLSNGAAYGDLDNDGDLDLVINVLDDKALLYRNNANELDSTSFVKVRLKGPAQNRFGIGAKVVAYSGKNEIYQEAYYSRGFCSSVEPSILFGTKSKTIDSILVIWPDSKSTVIRNPTPNSIIEVEQANPNQSSEIFNREQTLLIPIDKKNLPEFVHHENAYSAFSLETLIPHALTNQGPPMAVGDINGDKLEDVYLGGSKNYPGQIFLQSKNGTWKEGWRFNLLSEVTGAVFIDVDNDTDLDLVTVSGGQEEFTAQALMPKLYLNNGKGEFKYIGGSFGSVLINASCIKAMDYDADGDTDLFIGASVMPGLYGMSPVSYLLDNSGNNFFSPNQKWLGNTQFDNPTKIRPGMVKDAVWSKVNDDNLIDLILVGEWMPITILIQQSDHTFKNQTSEFNLSLTRGWWNSIVAHDFDNDGDDDWVVGNLGHCSRLRATPNKPVKMYLGDFDSNGGSDHILVYFNGEKSYPFTSRDQLVKQLPGLKRKFLKYKDYRDVNLEDIITPVQKGNSAVMQVEMLESVFLENTDGKIKLRRLPVEAQVAPVMAICAEDVNQDGFTDLILGGNLSEVQPELGPYDSSYGLVILGDGKNNWRTLPGHKSGLIVKGEVRSIRKINGPEGSPQYLFTVNNRPIVGYKNRNAK